MTSLEVTRKERELLDDLAKAHGVTKAEILRRGLRLYAGDAASDGCLRGEEETATDT